jgi:HK97 family phage major capsid protein
MIPSHIEAASRNIPAHLRAQLFGALAKHYSELEPLEDPAYEKFSIARLLLACAQRRPLPKREDEIVRGAALMSEQVFEPDRFLVPLGAIAVRALATTPGPKGGFGVGVTTADPADVLLPWSVVASAGATILSNLRENAVLPRDTAQSTINWLGENPTAPSETPPTLGEASLTAKTALALVKFSVQLLRQGEAVEAYIRARLLRAAGEALDVAFFAGAGGVQPLGLLNSAGIGTQSGTGLAHAGTLAMRKAILNAGGRESNLSWVGTPAVQETLGGRQRFTGVDSAIWDRGQILNAPAFATKNAPASALTVGDFSQAAVGIWGPGIRIDIDPSQDFNSAGLVARVLLMCDVAFPQPAAFTVATSIT